jgi:hypothetical protein
MFDPRLTVRLWGTRWATHASCVVVLAVVVGGVLSRLIGVEEEETSRGWLVVTVPTFVVVVLVLAGHEAVRAGVWRRQGTSIRWINLTLFGGSVEVTEGTATPRGEAIGALTAFVALAAVAALLAGLAMLTRHSTAWLQAPVKTVAVAAVALVALQAMPALHLDGGRVLHAWFWYLTDSASAATRAAAMYAHLVAAALLGVGIVLVARPGEWPYWGLGAVVAGLQLEGAARRAVRRASWLPFDAATTIRVLSLPVATRVPAGTSIDDAVEQLLAASPDACLLIVGAGGAVQGTLRMIDLRGTRRSLWERTAVGDVARPLAELPRLAMDLPVQEALLQMEERNGVALVEDEGRVVAVVSRGSLLAAATDHLRRHV